jgi:hypothetical protein
MRMGGVSNVSFFVKLKANLEDKNGMEIKWHQTKHDDHANETTSQDWAILQTRL